MALEVIALIDDRESDLANWQDIFLQFGIEARTFSDKDVFARCLTRGDHFDAIILDWYLGSEDSSILSRTILEQTIRPNRFIPVLIYTGEQDIAKDEIQSLAPPFNKITVVSKDVSAADLAEQLKTWYSKTTSARLAEVWRNTRRQAFEQSLYDLEAIEGENLQRSLQHVLMLDSGEASDVEHAMDFLERFVARRVLSNTALRSTLRNELDAARKQQGFKLNGSGEMMLVNSHRYIPMHGDSNHIRTGDFVRIALTTEPPQIRHAVVITPACDLENRKCVEVRLIMAEKTDLEKGRNDSEMVLNAVWSETDKSFHNYLLNFHRTLFIIDKEFQDNPQNRKGRAIAYSHAFTDILGQNYNLTPICRIDDPYRSDLLQKFSSHAARIGIP